jgi:hypothetical protein
MTIYKRELRKERERMKDIIPHLITIEAQASVTLDHDPSCHTCNPECVEYPDCPGNHDKECHCTACKLKGGR